MPLHGKGFFTVNLSECEGGDPDSILAAAQAAGLSNVFIKIADGPQAAGINASGVDQPADVIRVLQSAGMTVWGWQAVYGGNPSAEAAIAISRTQALGLDGLVVSAGKEYEQTGMYQAAQQFITTVRAALKVPIALSSFRFPNYHLNFPWSDFLGSCDLHMPQVYWEQAHDASEQLIESKRQCDALPNARPYIPTGAAYTAPGWTPTDQDITDFLDTAQVLGLPAVNFYAWDTCHAGQPLLWKAIASFAWSGQSQVPSTTQNPAGVPSTPRLPQPEAFQSQYLSALNSRNGARAGELYDPSAIQVWADQIRRGVVSIQAGFTTFFTGLPTGTIFSITSAQVKDDLHTLTWKAGSLAGETILTLKNGKIILDYTFIF